MVKTMFKVFYKVLLAIGAVFAALLIIRCINDRRESYIEIYNDYDDFDEEMY